jgi:hypothetical protein
MPSLHGSLDQEQYCPVSVLLELLPKAYHRKYCADSWNNISLSMASRSVLHAVLVFETGKRTV